MGKDWASLRGQQLQRLTKRWQHHGRHLFACLATHMKTRALPRGQQGKLQKKPLEQFYLSPPTQSSQQKAPEEKLLKQFNIKLAAQLQCAVWRRCWPAKFSPQFIFSPRLSAGLADAPQSTPTDAAQPLWLLWRHMTDKRPHPEVKVAQKTSKQHKVPLSNYILVRHHQVQERQKELMPSRNTISRSQICSFWNLSEVFPAKVNLLSTGTWWMQPRQVSVKQLL